MRAGARRETSIAGAARSRQSVRPSPPAAGSLSGAARRPGRAELRGRGGNAGEAPRPPAAPRGDGAAPGRPCPQRKLGGQSSFSGRCCLGSPQLTGAVSPPPPQLRTIRGSAAAPQQPRSPRALVRGETEAQEPGIEDLQHKPGHAIAI